MNDTSKTELDATEPTIEWLIEVLCPSSSPLIDFNKHRLYSLIAQREQAAELRGRIDELQNAFRELNKVPFEVRLKYYDDRLAELQATTPEKGTEE